MDDAIVFRCPEVDARLRDLPDLAARVWKVLYGGLSAYRSRIPQRKLPRLCPIQFQAFSCQYFFDFVQAALALRQLGVVDESREVAGVDRESRQREAGQVLDVGSDDGDRAMGNRVARDFSRAIAQDIMGGTMVVEECDVCSPVMIHQVAAAGAHEFSRECIIDYETPIARGYLQVLGK